jgi:enoyl-CoA hydratase/carnithine racemase
LGENEDFQTVTIEIARDEGVLILTLNRPEKKNALSNAMYKALCDALEAASSDASVRSVLLRGAGDCFTAGNDLADFAAVSNGEIKEPYASKFLEVLVPFEKPVVAAVHGLAVGIGVTMLLHCDLVYVADDAKLSTPFVNLALAPEAASSLLLTARIGHAKAFSMFVLGEAVDGRTASIIGLATASGPAADMHAKALASAKALARKPQGSVRITKKLMRDLEPIVARMREEGEIFAQRLRTAEAAEAFQAFAERRQPDFTNL